jgi:hypothetical protein
MDKTKHTGEKKKELEEFYEIISPKEKFKV